MLAAGPTAVFRARSTAAVFAFVNSFTVGGISTAGPATFAVATARVGPWASVLGYRHLQARYYQMDEGIQKLLDQLTFHLLPWVKLGVDPQALDHQASLAIYLFQTDGRQ